MRQGVGLVTGGALLALVCGSTSALAQRASENAVANADDAFGSNVGLETTGIYSENDTRGFSPLKAGNSRIDGVYFDQVSTLPSRLKQSTAIRVGFAAEEYPFQAPTGIVDNRLKPWPNELGASIGLTYYPFGGLIADADFRVPVVADHIGFVGGISRSETRLSSGQRTKAWGIVARPIFRYGGFEFSPFAAVAKFTEQQPQPVFVAAGSFVPQLPQKRIYLGQPWAGGVSWGNNYGANIKGPLTSNLSLRAGFFLSESLRRKNYSEIFALLDRSGLASHRLISDPPQDIYSKSGEAQLAWRLGDARWRHRFILGYRMRDRHTDSGGSDSTTLTFDPAILGTVQQQPEPVFTYRPVNIGRVRQSSIMFGYIGRIEGLGSINLGVQRARYTADFRDGVTGTTTHTSESALLYNASLGFNLTRTLSAYAATQRGLEDSGVAPETVSNRNEQLPATRTTQYEGGLRWKFEGGQLVVNAFQITKAYFADLAGRYVQAGQVRHRGVEASLTAHMFDKRLTVLAGGVLMQPRVLGPAAEAGIVGRRPVGTPSLFARLDANYRTDLLGGLTATAAVVYTGSRAAGSRPQTALGGEQLTLPGYATVDLGLRHQFKLNTAAVSFRVVVQNVFDTAAWHVVGANSLTIEERRRLLATMAMDF